MTVVIDASVALKWVLDEPGSDSARALHGEELIAPVLWLAETANALWRRVDIGELSAEDARARVAALLAAPVASLPIEPYVEAALGLATELRHPVYDCLYLAVALQYETHVITADRRLAALAAQPRLTGRVRLLGN